MGTEPEITVKPVDEYDVDVRETLERKLEDRGIDAKISTYDQPMLVATTRRKVGEDLWQSFKIEIEADALCTQEELEAAIERKIDDLVDGNV